MKKAFLLVLPIILVASVVKSQKMPADSMYRIKMADFISLADSGFNSMAFVNSILPAQYFLHSHASDTLEIYFQNNARQAFYFSNSKKGNDVTFMTPFKNLWREYRDSLERFGFKQDGKGKPVEVGGLIKMQLTYRKDHYIMTPDINIGADNKTPMFSIVIYKEK